MQYIWDPILGEDVFIAPTTPPSKRQRKALKDEARERKAMALEDTLELQKEQETVRAYHERISMEIAELEHLID